MGTILETIHGSHLYGLAHAESDTDTYRVLTDVDISHAHQTKTGMDDTLTVSLNRFTEQVAQGVPQALEALWSPGATTHPHWCPFLRALRPGINEANMRYRRTIRNFAFNLGGRTGGARREADELKLKRHALRLLVNLRDLNEHGRFNPRLTESQVTWVKREALSTGFEKTVNRLLSEAVFN